MSSFWPRRQLLVSSEEDMFDTAENYYGPKTNPSHLSAKSKLGRVRTFSVFEPKTKLRFFDDYCPLDPVEGSAPVSDERGSATKTTIYLSL